MKCEHGVEGTCIKCIPVEPMWKIGPDPLAVHIIFDGDVIAGWMNHVPRIGEMYAYVNKTGQSEVYRVIEICWIKSLENLHVEVQVEAE